jgi:DNA replication and repair protein RecF
VRVATLGLTDFRCYERADLELPVGVTVIHGDNGQGKTSLLEAIGWVAHAKSFRGVPDTALVREGASSAVIRAELFQGDRQRLVEAELRIAGRNRILVDRNAVSRTRDLLGVLRVTVFAPDDLRMVKEGPGERRAYLDELLVAVAPRYEAARADYERVLRHRNALLRGGVRDADTRTTLDVFDDQLVTAGSELVRGRLRLVERLAPALVDAYASLAGTDPEVVTRYQAEWAEGASPPPDDVTDLLRAGLAARRRQELDRGVTLVGPHRDEWRLTVDGLDSRTHASQGEQRTLALALRLAGHRVHAEAAGTEPVLLLDDVFSELDEHRATSLVRCLPATQTLVTTASVLPPDVHPEQQLRVVEGRLVEV